MKKITLGTDGPVIGRIGLGLMGMSAFYTGAAKDDAGAIRTIQRALDLGVTFLDTAEIYGPYLNEELLARALGGRRDEVVIATKFGTIRHSIDDKGGLDGSAANVRLSVEGSLRRLGTDHIDLYYQHRMDPGTPIEETVGALAELIAEGKILPLRPVRGCTRDDPARARRAPGHRAADRVLAVEPRPRSRDPSDGARARASGSCPIRHWGAGSSPARSARSISWMTATSASRTRGSPTETSMRTS